MCIQVYIGSDKELPLVEWNEKWDEEGAILVQKFDYNSYDDDKFAEETLQKEYKYHVSCWQGCGCGFGFNDEITDDMHRVYTKQSIIEAAEAAFGSIDEADSVYKGILGGSILDGLNGEPAGNTYTKENRRNKQSVEALFEYIRANVEGNCELLSFWGGDREIKSRDVIDLKNFVMGNKFHFESVQHITVYT